MTEPRPRAARSHEKGQVTVVKIRGFSISSLASARAARCALILIFSLCAAIPAAFASEVKVTFKNKTDRDIYVAVCWPKETGRTEEPDLTIMSVMWKKGWYKVEPGKQRTVEMKDMGEVYQVNLDDYVGFYAESTLANGKKIFWRGTDQNTTLIGDIHPTKAFDTSECSILDGKQVRFQNISLKEVGNDSFGATISFTRSQ
jgi:hypothetical protein